MEEDPELVSVASGMAAPTLQSPAPLASSLALTAAHTASSPGQAPHTPAPSLLAKCAWALRSRHTCRSHSGTFVLLTSRDAVDVYRPVEKSAGLSAAAGYSCQ